MNEEKNMGTQEPVAEGRTWHKGNEQHGELDWTGAVTSLPDGNHKLYTHPSDAAAQKEKAYNELMGSLQAKNAQIAKLETHNRYLENKHTAMDEQIAKLEAENAALREALEYLIERAETSDECQYGTLSTRFVLDVARAALGEKK